MMKHSYGNSKGRVDGVHWPRIRTVGGLLQMRQLNFGSVKCREFLDWLKRRTEIRGISHFMLQEVKTIEILQRSKRFHEVQCAPTIYIYTSLAQQPKSGLGRPSAGVYRPPPTHTHPPGSTPLNQ